MSTRHKTVLLPRKHTLGRWVWRLLLVLLVVWIVKHPEQARQVAEQIGHAVHVLFVPRGGGA
jgi:hypothetical protein